MNIVAACIDELNVQVNLDFNGHADTHTHTHTHTHIKELHVVVVCGRSRQPGRLQALLHPSLFLILMLSRAGDNNRKTESAAERETKQQKARP
jgi:hypothetical protein